MLLNSPKTKLSLIRKREDNKTDLSLTVFWLFNLKIPQLTDFSFWCAISKSGKEDSLVFGINKSTLKLFYFLEITLTALILKRLKIDILRCLRTKK